ncbi:hypothetical protein [Myxococcus sp. RHSTA-1-4]|nr:hypothetical protein [Myxococcus sp. RHSTA-1-4]MBZ4417284.1 hypothetical protein [Myxococcus sp. RHSTA-1-4]
MTLRRKASGLLEMRSIVQGSLRAALRRTAASDWLTLSKTVRPPLPS